LLKVQSFNCKGKGKLDQVDGKFLMTEITLEPTVVLLHEKEIDRALRVLEKSEKACLISNSIKSEIVMNSTIAVSRSETNSIS
jgi:organic hydroperoxide reductase OsmC/OhrA